MICPFCKKDNDKVVDSRVSGSSIRRRRECCECGKRFTTREYIEVQPLTVIKRSGEHEPFQREKLLRGIMNSCKKRPVSVADIEQLATNVENALTVTENFEVSYEQIGNLVMQELKKLDAVAYVRFASIYREFKEVGEFVDHCLDLPRIQGSRRIRGPNQEHGQVALRAMSFERVRKLTLRSVLRTIEDSARNKNLSFY